MKNEPGIKKYFNLRRRGGLEVRGAKVEDIEQMRVELMVDGQLYKEVNISLNNRFEINQRIDNLLKPYRKFLENKNWELYICIRKKETPETWTMIPDYE
jgi:hypothetical protein